MEHTSEMKFVKIESDVECKEENESDKNIITQENIPKIKQEHNDSNYDEKTNFPENSTYNYSSNILEAALVKPEIESEVEDNYVLSQSDIEKEFEAFNQEDEQKNSGKTILENNTTAYKCQICGDIFQKFLVYKDHKRNHFIEKRRSVYMLHKNIACKNSLMKIVSPTRCSFEGVYHFPDT